MPSGIYIRVKKLGGWKHSKETKQKMSKIHLGNKYCLGYKQSDETKRKNSESHLAIGYKMSEENKLKMSLSKMGDKNPMKNDETRKKVGDSNKGKKRSDEHKRKMSDRLKKEWAEGKRTLPTNLTHKGFKHSEETRVQKSLSMVGKHQPWHTGENNHFWKGGITPINMAIRKSLEYKIWRTAVFERDGYACVWCDSKFIKGETGSVVLHVDHIKTFSQHPELRFDIDNGRTLCVPCHKTTETYGGNRKYINN